MEESLRLPLRELIFGELYFMRGLYFHILRYGTNVKFVGMFQLLLSIGIKPLPAATWILVF